MAISLPKSITKKHATFTASVIVAFIVIALTSILFVELADEVREQETLGVDRAILTAINQRSTPFLDTVMPVATDIGGVVGGVAVTTSAVLFLAAKKRYRKMTIILMSVLGAVGLNLILKSLFMRQRPDLWTQLVHESGYSFPSGHAMMSASFGVALMIVLWDTRWRWWGVGLGVLYAGFVGFSRMYLGVHYPTDVLGGWLIATAWVVTSVLLIRYVAPRTGLTR